MFLAEAQAMDLLRHLYESGINICEIIQTMLNQLKSSVGLSSITIFFMLSSSI